jgi:hypothetical protein
MQGNSQAHREGMGLQGGLGGDAQPAPPGKAAAGAAQPGRAPLDTGRQ